MRTPIRIAKVVYEPTEKCPVGLAGLSRENKIFSRGRERCVRARGPSDLLVFRANFAAVALFSGRSVLLKLFARKLPVISSGEKKENQTDRSARLDLLGDEVVSPGNCLTRRGNFFFC